MQLNREHHLLDSVDFEFYYYLEFTNNFFFSGIVKTAIKSQKRPIK